MWRSLLWLGFAARLATSGVATWGLVTAGLAISGVALAAPASSSAPAPKLNTTHLISVTPLRQKLMLDYIHQHNDPAATTSDVLPQMIVIHWTAINSLQSTLSAFTPDVLTGRGDIQRGGKLNTGAQFVVDQDGTIYQLLGETVLARHTIGLNRVAIGIENVGSGSLTAAQLAADTALVKYLAHKYPVEYLIGHYEYGAFRGSALWQERDKTYFTAKIDPGPAFMQALRARLAREGIRLKGAP